MDSKRDRAHDIAEEGLDKIIEGDEKTGRKMVEEAKKLDPEAVDELTEEIERDKESAERFIGKDNEKDKEPDKMSPDRSAPSGGNKR